MTINTGGPAFPVPFSLGTEVEGPVFADCYGNGGMTLRDYFAAKALAAIVIPLLQKGETNSVLDAIYPGSEHGRDAYRIADAMLAAREETSK